jgi:hypothetical protein
MGYLSRLRRSWCWSPAAAIWMLLGLVPLLFFQTTVHEGSHCAAMELLGGDCRVLAPFPVALPNLYLHGVTIGGDADDEMAVPVIVAPQIAAALLIVGLRALARRVRDERWALLTRLWLLGACLDLLNNTLWRPRGGFGDWSVMASQLGLSKGVLLAVSVPMWGIALGGLLTPLPVERPARSATVRSLSGIGLVYAAISLLAIVVSVSVRVPESDPSSLWHRVPILLHAATVVVCLALVTGARLTRKEGA